MISKSKKNYDFLSKYSIEYSLILILPIAAIFSIFLLEVILLCIVLSFLLRNYFKFEKKYFFNKFSFYFALFFTYLFLRFIFNDTYSHENYLFVIFYFRYGLYVLSIFYFLNKLSNLHDNFIKVIILCIIILFLDGIVQYLLGSNILGYKLVSGNRVTSFFNSESILGSYLIKILPFVYIFFLSKTSSKKNFLFLLIVIMCVYLTFISGERASFALILLMTFYFIVINRKIYFSKISLFFSFSIVILLIFFSSENIHKRYLQTFDEIFKVKDSSKSLKLKKDIVNNEILDANYSKLNFYIISPTHNNYFITAINMFKGNKIFGHGPKTYRNLCNEDQYGINFWSCSSHPHNYYLQLLAEFGLIGFLFPFSFFIFTCFKIYKIFASKIQNPYLIGAYSFIFINLWPITSTGNFFNNWISILIYIPLSFYLFYIDRNNE